MKAELKKERVETIGKRKLQAIETKQRIFDQAQLLFREKGIEKVGISDIVKAAHVSTGTFYLYFSSKEEIVAQIYLGADDFFESLPNQLEAFTGKKYIVEFFTRVSAHMEKEGVEIVRQLYYPTNPLMQRGREEKGKRPIVNAVKEAKKNKEIKTTMKAEDLADYLYSISSGIIFEWCLNDGSFELQKTTKKYFDLALRSL